MHIDLSGKTAIVTGSTSGIGKATALGLAAMGAEVAITGRNPDRIEDAAREIRAAGRGQVGVFIADLSSQAEVRRLAQEVIEGLPRLDVLVNNVGGYWNTRHVTADGLELGELAAGDTVTCSAGPRPARIVTLGPRDFHQILKAKFGLADR